MSKKIKEDYEDLKLFLLIVLAVYLAIMLSYAVQHEFEDCSEWFGQERKLYEFRNGIVEPSGNYVSSVECLYCAVFRQKGNYCQAKFFGE